MSTCQEPDCERPSVARGLCRSHYNTARMRAIRAATRAEVRQCRHCGADFTGKDSRAVFCSYACKEAHHTQLGSAKRLAARANRVCVQCGVTFTSTTAKASCCSKSCSIAYQNRRKQEARNAMRTGDERCPVCGGPIPESRRNGVTYCSVECKKREQDRRWRERAPHYMRQYLYGVTPEQFEQMLEAQGGVCAICGTDQWDSKGRGPHVDHDHATGRVRGILCTSCNNGLGRFRDDTALLLAAAKYLEAHAASPPRPPSFVLT